MAVHEAEPRDLTCHLQESRTQTSRSSCLSGDGASTTACAEQMSNIGYVLDGMLVMVSSRECVFRVNSHAALTELEKLVGTGNVVMSSEVKYSSALALSEKRKPRYTLMLVSSVSACANAFNAGRATDDRDNHTSSMSFSWCRSSFFELL